VSVVRVATCQFPVSARIGANLGYVTRQARAAKRRGADVAHFPEGALSGYAGTDFETFTDFDWDALRVAGVLVTTVDTEQDLYDSTAAWRGRAMAGVLHSGTLVSDPRSADRTSL
jgi:deaminated glutathione amidase